jgi:hypothetical protein
LVTYLFGGSVAVIAVVMLLVIGLVLTLAPVVYVALERAQMLKVAAVVLLFLVGAVFAIGADAWADLPQVVTNPGIPAAELGFAVLLGALAFAGGGGGQNLVQANWIRDKGFGMGKYVPRLVSPVTGEPEAAPSTGYVFVPDEQNMARWRGWWRFSNMEQLVTFVLITFITILFTSLLAYSTVYGREGLANNIGFIRTEGEVLSGSSVRSRCSPPRWASSTTPAGSPRTSSRPRTGVAATRARSTPGSSGAWSSSASRWYSPGSASRSCCS